MVPYLHHKKTFQPPHGADIDNDLLYDPEQCHFKMGIKPTAVVPYDIVEISYAPLPQVFIKKPLIEASRPR